MASITAQGKLGLHGQRDWMSSKGGRPRRHDSSHIVIPRKIQKGPLVRASSNKENEPSKGKGPSVDWDKQWKSFKSQQGMAPKKGPFQFMEKYVSRSPPQSNFSLMEEVDSFRRTEKSALNFWTNPKFTYAGFGVIVGLFVYMVVIVGPPPTR